LNMGRFRQVANNIVSSYAVLVLTAVSALASLPLALHYLAREQDGLERFGLWTLMSSIGGYLSLIDLGMSGSIARHLIDHKDERNGGAYGGMIKTGWLVLGLQGAFILSAAWILAPLLSHLLLIPENLRGEFVALMRWLGAMLAFSFSTRMFSHILQAHQRMDIVNYGQTLALGLNFGLLWMFFATQKGVFSLIWAQLISLACSVLIFLVACVYFRFFPAVGAWGRASWSQFREVFDFGKDMFLVAVGTQMILASQTMIITRRLGLDASAAWYAGTRAFNLVCQLIWRISDSAGPAFAEMMVRRENSLLRERYRAVVTLTAAVSGFAAVTYALCNSVFVFLLTHGKIQWPPINDLLLGAWMIVLAISHCHNGFALITKKVGFMRYIYFLEGGIFVATALIIAKWAGLPGMILCSLICSVLFNGAYGVWRIRDYFGLTIWEAGVRWLAPMGQVLIIFAPLSVAAWWLFRTMENSYLRMAISAAYCGLVGVYILLRLGVSRTLQRELVQRAPKLITPLLRRVLGYASEGIVGLLVGIFVVLWLSCRVGWLQ
jgi:O-antigen/teichoic acid export membrane protein